MRILLALLLLLCSFGAVQAEEFDYSAFAQIPVLHEGRIKPLDSFARIHLREFSGQDNEAAAWLAQTLFDPADAAKEKIFFVQHKTLREQLGLPVEQSRFSLLELQIGLQKTARQLAGLLAADEGSLADMQHELLQLHENAAAFVQLMRSFSLILPLAVEVPEAYRAQVDMEIPSYVDLMPLEPQITEDLAALVANKGEALDYYTAEEKKLANLGFQLSVFREAGQGNALLRIMPDAWGDAGGDWYSPWMVMLQGEGSPAGAAYFDLWRKMAMAYRAGDAEGWAAAGAQALAHVQAYDGGFHTTKVQAEILYNSLHPYRLTLALYGFGLLLVLVSFFVPPSPSGLRRDKAAHWMLSVAQCAVVGGVLVHLAGILARVYILGRPPVGTLYESVLFVSLICAAIALLISFLRRDGAALFAGLVAAFSLLGIAPYLLPTGESMEMLVAVLNTNFWLSTHVLCITIGYGVCILAACFAHAYLVLRLIGREVAWLNRVQHSIYRISLVALLFTAVGTILGGIWADQSWGRFWGWDPKENGALLIVLWLIWLQHGRVSGALRGLYFVIGIAYLNVIVALAWFGVNLLSVGLHSYGFTSGMAGALGAFCALQTLILGVLLILIQRRKEGRHAA